MKSKEAKENKRKSNFLQVAPANYLIVCEGKQTEPNYFNGLKQEINKKYGNKPCETFLYVHKEIFS